MKKFLKQMVWLLVFVGTFFALRYAFDEGSGEMIVWNTYNGDFDGYTVRIEESDKGQGMRRQVHLDTIDPNSELRITGHDYDGDGAWEVIYYCGKGSSGCNGMSLSSNGKMTWEPCNADKDKVEPFLVGEVMYAKYQLDQAMILFHRPEFRFNNLES